MNGKNAEYQEKLLLDQHYKALDMVQGANDALDSKASTLLRSSSLIVSLFGAVGLYRLATGQEGNLALILVALLVASFIVMVIVTTWSWAPQTLDIPGGAPTNEEWPRIKKRFLEGSVEESFTAALGDCLKATRAAAVLNREKSLRVRFSTGLFVFQLILLIALLITLGPVS